MKKQLLMTLLIITMNSIQANLRIEPITDVSLVQHREIFCKTWVMLYESCSLQQLALTDLRLFLHEQFDIDEEKHQKNKNFITLQAIDEQNENIVGYVSCDIKDDHSLYIVQCALLPNYENEDNFRTLIFSLLKNTGPVIEMSVDLRIIAEQYRELFTKIGFQELLEHPAFDKNLYVRYGLFLGDRYESLMDNEQSFEQKVFIEDESLPEENVSNLSAMTDEFGEVKDKCGTCVCGYEEQDFEHDLPFECEPLKLDNLMDEVEFEDES